MSLLPAKRDISELVGILPKPKRALTIEEMDEAIARAVARSSRVMIGIDTNVLVRLIVADEPRQTSAARNFIRDRCTATIPGSCRNIVLAEIAWTLAAGYGYSRHQIADAIERIMETDPAADRVID